MAGILEDIKAQLDRCEVRLAKCEAPTMGGMVDQQHSPLGRRGHCEAVRRLVAQGDTRAYITKNKRRHLMTVEALREVMLEDMRGATGPANTQSAEDDVFYRDLMKEVGG